MNEHLHEQLSTAAEFLRHLNKHTEGNALILLGRICKETETETIDEHERMTNSFINHYNGKKEPPSPLNRKSCQHLQRVKDLIKEFMTTDAKAQ